MRFIHAADIHLDSPLAGMAGRHPDLAGLVSTCTRDAFSNLVDQAIAQDVDFLLIAGDLYDAEQRNYETALFFAREMGRLGRPCFMIHGNHDATSRITRSLQPPPNVTVLPAHRPGTAVRPELGVAVHGQSFHGRAETAELAGEYPAPVAGLFNIGLLHTSLEDPGEHASYAPCRLSTLTARGYDYWALGHIHTRASLHDAPTVHFPGNTQGRHVRETGPRGATLVEVGDDGRVRGEPAFLPTDVLRWAVARVDATGLDAPEALAALLRHVLGAATRDAHGRPVIVRVVLEGATALHAGLLADPAGMDARCRAVAAELPDVHVERVKLQTRPAEGGGTGDGLQPLEQAVRAALADPALRARLLEEFTRLRNAIPAGAEAMVPRADADLAGLEDDAWAIVRHALTAGPAAG